MEKLRIICRNSRLSLLQAEIVRQKIIAVDPGCQVEIIGRTSLGDREVHINLSVLDGTDFFTEDIFNSLQKGEAEIAVHSLKDMTATHFFSHKAFALVQREDARDLAVFNSNAEEKLKAGESIVIGTSSPRRSQMAMLFLQKALPQLNNKIKIEIKSIRGNVERRLEQLNEGNYDGTILATAGLNRLLKSEHKNIIEGLISTKKLMLLPLIECVPAPCQGAIVAEADPANKEAVALLNAINDTELMADAVNEKKYAARYGTGCLQKFGVTSICTTYKKYLYAGGEDADGQKFFNWQTLPDLQDEKELIFSTTDFMKDFFEYRWSSKLIEIKQPVVFVANSKSITGYTTAINGFEGGGDLPGQNINGWCNQKTILASGTKTWYELAKQGYWVTACADGLGVEFLLSALHMPILNIRQEDICILTNKASAARWELKGLHAEGNYELIPAINEILIEKIRNATIIFWSSYAQYHHFGRYAGPEVKHLCAGGETAALLVQQGIDPIIFPTIKSFNQWKQLSTPLQPEG